MQKSPGKARFQVAALTSLPAPNERTYSHPQGPSPGPMTRLLQYLLEPAALPLLSRPCSPGLVFPTVPLPGPTTDDPNNRPSSNLIPGLTLQIIHPSSPDSLPHVIHLLQPVPAQKPATWAPTPRTAHPPCELQQHIGSGLLLGIQRLAVVFIKIGRHGSRGV